MKLQKKVYKLVYELKVNNAIIKHKDYIINELKVSDKLHVYMWVWMIRGRRNSIGEEKMG